MMSDVTQILSQIDQGDPNAADQLLLLVYDEMRRLAARRMAAESSDHTLDATDLVHEAYIRLVGGNVPQRWSNRGHFFAAAAEAMRRILVEHARRKASQKRGGDRNRQQVELDDVHRGESAEVLLIHSALDGLDETNPLAAQLVKYRYFAGFTNQEAAEMLGVSPRKASQIWTYARTWLLTEIESSD